MSNVVHLLSHQRVTPEDDADNMLPDIRAVAVLFLSHGRNAWHSTWIRRYSVGSFFRDGRRARNAVESGKTRGTVFYMRVLPALQINYGTRRFLLTEINTPEPLRHLDLSETRFGLIGRGLTHFLDMLTPPSSLWKPGQATEDHVILQEVAEDFIDLTSYSLLAKGRDAGNNPPLGSYKRVVTGTFGGETEWHWSPLDQVSQQTSLRWFNKGLEAMVESRERLAEIRQFYAASAR